MTPSLSTSNSNSNSLGSPPLPVTPVVRAGRPNSRYPDLGRVPLHRRGTSQTYERLEDLLREAGYKETRVFTPETERIARQAEDGGDERSQKSLRGVVDFITGLGATLGRSSSLRQQSSESKDHSDLPSRPNSVAYRPKLSPPASPLPQRFFRQSPIPSRPPTPGSITSVECAGPTPKASYHNPKHIRNQRSQLPHGLYENSNGSQASIRSQQYLARGPASSRGPRKIGQSSKSALPHRPSEPNILHPQPSRAGAYLRHMASVASMPARPSSTPVRQLNLNEEDDDIAPRRRGNGEGEEDQPPPLPKTWLETVARAVMFGGVGYVGGPQQHQQQQPEKETDARGRSTDRQTLRPPELMSRMSGRRSGRSESEVSRTRVVCHSAPPSRGASRSRDRGDSVETKPRTNTKRNASRPNVPSLARTKVEGENSDWRPSGKRPTPTTRFLAGWGMDADASHSSSSSDELTDDDDGELDLRQMLVPPKRQNSIRSLRRHLSDVNGEPSRRPGLGRVTSGFNPDYGQWDGYSEQHRSVWGRRRDPPVRRGSFEEDDEGRPYFDSRRSMGSNTRTGLPTVWS